jgi:hypothetical protein
MVNLGLNARVSAGGQMKLIWVLTCCFLCQNIDAEHKTFSFDRLSEFYDDFICEEKQVLASAQTLYPPGFLAKWTNGGIEWTFTTLNPPAWNNPLAWQNPQEIEAVILTQWKMMRVPLSAIGLNLITMQQPAWDNANVYFDILTNEPGEWSFFQVTWFENTLAFLTEPGQWYLDYSDNYLYYIPLSGEDITTADVELPILETLIEGQGTVDQPVHNIRFEGLTFSYATWLGPSGSNGYVSDQRGQLLVGSGHTVNYIGHDQYVVPTPANLPFIFSNNITFYGNIFQHLAL